MKKLIGILLLVFSGAALADSPSFYLQVPGFAFGYSEPRVYVPSVPYIINQGYGYPRYNYPQEYNVIIPPRYQYYQYRHWDDHHDHHGHGHHRWHHDRD